MRRVATAVAIVAAAAAVGVAGPAGVANAATNVLYAHLDPVVHHCVAIGDAFSPYDGIDYQGVVCVDLRAYAGGPVEADVEAICQIGPESSGYGTEVQCAHVWVDGLLASAAPVSDGSEGQCGHAFGPCSATRNIWEVGLLPLYDSNPQTCGSDLKDNYWAVAQADNGVIQGTKIELPGSGQLVYLYSNYSSGHYQICP